MTHIGKPVWRVLARLTRRDPILPREIVVLAVISFIVAIGFGVIGPAIPLLAAQFGVGAAIAGTAISAFALFRFLSAMGSGRLAERYGERRVLTAGLLLQAVTSVLAGLAPTFTLLVAFRAIGGLGSAAFTIASLALLIRLVPQQWRGRAMSLYQGGFILGSIAGPAFGGLLTEISPRLPLIVYGGCLLLAAVVGHTMLRSGAVGESSDETLRSEQLTPAGRPRGSLADALRNRAYLAALLANLGIGWVFYGMRSALLPLYITHRLGQSAGWAGFAFLLSAATQALCLMRAGRISDSWGSRPALLLGLGVAVLSVASFALPLSAMAFLVPMVAFGVAGALLTTAPAAVIGEVSTGNNQRIIALFSMMADLGGIAGPLVSGWLTDRYSYPAAFGFATAILTAGFLVALSIRSEPGLGGRHP